VQKVIVFIYVAGYTSDSNDGEDAGPGQNIDMFAQQMFQLLGQQLNLPAQRPPAQPRQQAATEHQGHAAGDRNIHAPQTMPGAFPAPGAGASFTMSFGNMAGAFPAPGDGDQDQAGPGGNPMLRGIASLLSNQFSGIEGGPPNPLAALLGMIGGSGNPGYIFYLFI
jgi:hypothetical protein